MIYYLTPTPPRLSETFITDELEMLKALGVAAKAMALNPEEDAPPKRERLKTWVWLLRRRWYCFPSWLWAVRRFRGTARWVVLRSLDLAAVWVRDRPDRVHVHFVDQTAVAGALACRFWRVPITATAHARDIFEPPPIWLPALSRYGMRFVAVCRYNRDELLARGIPANAIAVIPCGVRTTIDAASARPNPNLGGRLRILVISRLVAKKGIDDLLRALAMPHIAHATEGLRIIGDGPERARLEAMACQSMSAGPPVHFLGALDRREHTAHQHWANVFCLPCKIAPDGDRDSMPVAIKEALVAHLPVVTTTAVGIPEMLDSGTAILVEPGNGFALGAALMSYATLDHEARSRLADAGNARVIERFDLRETVGALRDFMLEHRAPTTWSQDADE